MLGDPSGSRSPNARTDTGPTPRLADTFAGRVLVQGVALLGVAAVVTLVVDDRSEQTSARLAEVESQLALVQHERDRMQRLAEELTTELTEATVEAEIVRWQLSYTEERYTRLRDATPHSGADATHPTPRPGPPVEFVSLDPTHGAPPDAPPGAPPTAATELPAPQAVLALSLDPHTATDLPSGPSPIPMAYQPLELESLDGSSTPPAVSHLDSQLERDRAFSVWNDVMSEAADRECGRRVGAGAKRCRDRVKRTLFPMGSRAVDCIVNGNASADYVAGIPLDQLPTHSVPLDHGAVIMCDRGLHNL